MKNQTQSFSVLLLNFSENPSSNPLQRTYSGDFDIEGRKEGSKLPVIL
jgi:hypothetical protein